MERNYILITNDDYKVVRKALKEEIENGACYIVYANDKFLSGWGGANGRTHRQVVIAYSEEEKRKIIEWFASDKAFNRINSFYLDTSRIDRVINIIRNYSYSLRNDFKG